MADNIQLNPGSGGDTIATFDDGTAEWQKVLLAWLQGSTPTLVDLSNPLPVDIQALQSPQSSLATSASLVPGTSVDLDSAQISVGLTGQLVGLVIGGSAPLKAILKTVQNAIASSDLAVLWPHSGEPIWMPSKRFYTVAHDVGAGLDGFRVTITNLNTGSTGTDVYCTFLYDEV